MACRSRFPPPHRARAPSQGLSPLLFLPFTTSHFQFLVWADFFLTKADDRETGSRRVLNQTQSPAPCFYFRGRSDKVVGILGIQTEFSACVKMRLLWPLR